MSIDLSLRRRLLLTVLGIILPLTGGLTALLYAAVERSVWQQFDRDLVEMTTAYSELVESEGDAIDFELGPEPTPPGPELNLWLLDPDNRIVSQTRAPDPTGLPLYQTFTRPGMTLSRGQLADGTSVRVATLQFLPPVDDEFPPPTQPGMVRLVVARNTASLDAMLTELATSFLALGVALLSAVAFAVWWATRRGLAPINTFAQTLASIDVHALETRIDLTGLAGELHPIAAHTNLLLDRLQRVFEAERRFSSDVAHELRTPLSILRTEHELMLRRERTSEDYRDAFARNLTIIEELGRMVENLLQIARAEAGATAVRKREVNLHTFIDELWARHREKAHARELTFTNLLPKNTMRCTDADKLRMICDNLLANAVAYTQISGSIWVDTPTHDPEVILRVVDSGPVLSAQQCEQVFERFWRADEARSQAVTHCGLGLSLARLVAAQLGYSLTVEADTGNMVFVLRIQTSEGEL